MGRRISDKTKKLRGMGQGEGAGYKPYIITREFNSLGTASIIRDWKTGRQVHCLSQGEAMWYYILRWNDDNADIREQFPLDNELTNLVADKKGLTHPGGKDFIMTTDFLVTKSDGSLHAYSVKVSKNAISENELKSLYIEKIYWMAKKVPFTMLYKSEVNRTLYSNIRLIMEFYNPESVKEKYGAIKYKIAHKEINVDLSDRLLDTVYLDEIMEKFINDGD